jgi:hypothetical protein
MRYRADSVAFSLILIKRTGRCKPLILFKIDSKTAERFVRPVNEPAGRWPMMPGGSRRRRDFGDSTETNWTSYVSDYGEVNPIRGKRTGRDNRLIPLDIVPKTRKRFVPPVNEAGRNRHGGWGPAGNGRNQATEPIETLSEQVRRMLLRRLVANIGEAGAKRRSHVESSWSGTLLLPVGPPLSFRLTEVSSRCRTHSPSPGLLGVRGLRATASGGGSLKGRDGSAQTVSLRFQFAQNRVQCQGSSSRGVGLAHARLSLRWRRSRKIDSGRVYTDTTLIPSCGLR